MRARAFADLVVAAPDHERAAVDEGVGDLVPGALVDFRHGRAGDPHLRGALLVRSSFVVHDPQGFVLLHEQNDGRDASGVQLGSGSEDVHERLGTDASATAGSRHEGGSLKGRVIDICR